MPELLRDLAAGRDPSEPVQLTHSVASLAARHRMHGLLWSWARDRDVAPGLKGQLAMWDLSTQGHLAKVRLALREASEVAERLDIEVATVKGVTAEDRWYARSGERPCADVDLLIAPHHRHRAHELVAALQPTHPWNGPGLSAMLRSRGVQSITMVRGGIEVDLHLDLLKLGIGHRAAEDVWDGTCPYPIGRGHTVRVLDEASALLHLLIHLNKDRFQRLLGLADIPRILASGTVDWGRFEHLLRQDGISVPALSSLGAVCEELRLEWPNGVMPASGPRSRVWQVLWPPKVRLRGREGRLRYRHRQQWIPLLARDRTLEALSGVVSEAWPPRAAVAVRYRHIAGPYPWKLVRGRLQTLRSQKRALARERGR